MRRWIVPAMTLAIGVISASSAYAVDGLLGHGYKVTFDAPNSTNGHMQGAIVESDLKDTQGALLDVTKYGLQTWSFSAWFAATESMGLNTNVTLPVSPPDAVKMCYVALPAKATAYTAAELKTAANALASLSHGLCVTTYGQKLVHGGAETAGSQNPGPATKAKRSKHVAPTQLEARQFDWGIWEIVETDNTGAGKAGSLAVVQFGVNKAFSADVWMMYDQAPAGGRPYKVMSDATSKSVATRLGSCPDFVDSKPHQRVILAIYKN